MKKKPNYAEARREIIESGIRLGAGDFVDVDALAVAAEALERLSKQPAMKDHERIFFALCFNLRSTHKPREVVNLLAETIPHKRCWYYLRKWGNLGFYDYGVTEDLGWFYPEKLPQRYLEIVKHETIQQYIQQPAMLRDTIDASELLAAAKECLADLSRRWDEIHSKKATPTYMDDKTKNCLAGLAQIVEEKAESGLIEEG